MVMMQEKVLIIHGCPGTGKTTVCEKLSKVLNAKYINLSKIVIEERILIAFDEVRESYVPNLDLLLKRIIELISESKSLVIIEGHYADIIPSPYVYKAFVLRMHPLKLEKVLEMKGWEKKKIYENVLAEMLDACLISALEAYGADKVVEIDVTNKEADDIVKEILDILFCANLKTSKNKYINWFETLEREGMLKEYLTKFSSSES
ncbi:MAG: adenylate kinase family protein [Candidatus Methanomethylicia archaeon]